MVFALIGLLFIITAPKPTDLFSFDFIPVDIWYCSLLECHMRLSTSDFSTGGFC